MRWNKICRLLPVALLGIFFFPQIANAKDIVSTLPLPVSLIENASRPAGAYARQNLGIAIAVFLGTESSVTPEQIKTVLSREFVQAGVGDPIVFFFEQNDVPGTAVAYYFSDNVDGPFNLADARPQAVKTARTYLFRKSHDLLSYPADSQ